MKSIQEKLSWLPELSKSRRKFMVEMFSALLALRGKANYLNMSRYSKYSEKTFRRHSQQPFPFETLNSELSKAALCGSSILAGDASFIHKSGKHTYGLARFWNGSASRTERGLEISVLALVDESRQAMVLTAKQTPDLASEESRVGFYLRQLQDSRPYWPNGLKHGVFDGYYSKQTFVAGVCEAGLEMIGKLRQDANLRYLYDGPQKPRGRHKKYDGKVYFDDLSGFEYLGELEKDIHGYVQNVWHVSLKRPIRVVLLQSLKKPEKPTHVLLFSTDLNLSAERIIRYYGSRFAIEFLFRDAKQHLGLEDCQARNQKALDFHFNACFSALNLAKSEALKSYDSERPFVFSMQSQKCLSFNEHLLDRFISKFGLDQTCIKSKQAYHELLFYGAIAS